MQELLFITGNPHKVRAAEVICKRFDIQIKQATSDYVEIQAEDGADIARDKATKAYASLQKPLVVTDDSWIIPGLGGFPGPYMFYINKWLTSEDFLRLTLPLTDRRIILRQVAVYQDEREQVTFSVDIEGTLLKEIRGESPYPHLTIMTFDDDGTSAAEVHATGKSTTAHKHTAWHELAKWLQTKNEA